MSDNEFDPNELDELLNLVDEAANRDDETGRCATPIADGVLAGMAPAIPHQRSRPGGPR